MTQLRYTIQQHHINLKNSVRLSHVNLYHCNSSESNVFPGHPYTKIIFVQKGSGQLCYNEHCLTIQKNSFILINPDKHRFSIKIDNDSVDLVILGIENLFFYKDTEYLSFPFIETFHSEDEYQYFVDHIIHEVRKKPSDYEEACCYYLNLLLITMERQANIHCDSYTKNKRNNECEHIKKYLDEHFPENITLDILSQKSDMNKYYLVHSFTKHFGRSPINYLNEKRIDESKKLLETTSLSIAQIAETVGFSSQSYFSQAFKKNTLMTPNEYRHSVKEY